MNDIDVLIKLSHPDKVEFDKAVEAWRSQAFLATLVPDPITFNDHNKGCICTLCHKARTEWRQENWMTPHDLVDFFAEYASAQITNGTFEARFAMIGRPPLAALHYLHSCKNYDVTCFYYGPKHFGYGIYRNGTAEHHNLSSHDRSAPVSEELKDFAARCHGEPGPSIERAAREHFGRNVTPQEALDFMYGPFYNPSRGLDIQIIDFHE